MKMLIEILGQLLLGVIGVFAYCLMTAVGFLMWLVPLGIGLWMIRVIYNLFV